MNQVPVPGRHRAESPAPDDRAAVLDFLRRHYGPAAHQGNAAVRSWRFEQHPLAPGMGGEWLCRPQGAIVGYQARLPAGMTCRGEAVASAWAVDLMVEPEWRLRGVAPALNQAMVAGLELLCGINISEPAWRSFRRAGWIDLGCVPRMIRLIAPLPNGEPLSNSRSVTPRLAAASRLAAPLVRGFDAIALPAVTVGTAVTELTEMDDRLDAVWRLSLPHYPLVALRNRALLGWRFDRTPHARCYTRLLMAHRGQPVGYAVLRRRGEVTTVVDYLSPPRWAAALTAHCLMRARRDGAALLRMLAPPPRMTALRRLGFVAFRGPRLMACPAPASSLDRALLADPAAWHVTDADSDLDHALDSAPRHHPPQPLDQ